MPTPTHAKTIRAGRLLRGGIASIGLAFSALGALLLLTWSCCSTPSLAQKLGDPQLWLLAAAAVVAFAALPPVTRKLQARRVRWLLAPPTLANLAFCGWIGTEAWRMAKMDTDPGTARILLALCLAQTVCGLYVAWRVVLRPPRDR